MNYLFSDPEVWVLASDANAQSKVRAALERPFVSRSFQRLEDLDAHLSRISDVKPNLFIIDSEKQDLERLQSEFYTQRPGLQRVPLLYLASPSDLDSIMRNPLVDDFDYILKPLSTEELNLRLKINLKSAARHVRFMKSFLLSFAGDLTSTELKILFCFLDSDSRSISRLEITKLLWGEAEIHVKTLDVHLFNLRRKLAGVGCQIVSSRGGVWTLKYSGKDPKERAGT